MKSLVFVYYVRININHSSLCMYVSELGCVRPLVFRSKYITDLSGKSGDKRLSVYET